MPTTGTPWVSSTSSVAGRSRIALAPAQTTAIGVRPSSIRSADTSNGAPRCTPPMPPVANTRIPAWCATIIVPATVVDASSRRATAIGRSRRLHLRTLPNGRDASRSISSGDTPTVMAPREHSDCRGNGASLAHRPLHCECGFGIRRPRQAVRDQRRLESDNRNDSQRAHRQLRWKCEGPEPRGHCTRGRELTEQPTYTKVSIDTFVQSTRLITSNIVRSERQEVLR